MFYKQQNLGALLISTKMSLNEAFKVNITQRRTFFYNREEIVTEGCGNLFTIICPVASLNAYQLSLMSCDRDSRS